MRRLHPNQSTQLGAYAVGMYNPLGGWTIGRVWADPSEPDPAKANFPDGSVAVKLLFVEVPEKREGNSGISQAEHLDNQVPYLKNSFEWDALVSADGAFPTAARKLGRVRLIQIDVAVTRKLTRQALEALEARVLRALQERFLADRETFAVFCEGFTEELNRLRREHRQRVAAAPRELASINRRSKDILELLLKGFSDNAWKLELALIERRRVELEASIAASAREPVLPALHPHMATVYRQKC